ncbi:MAG: COG1361 S-layer family protein, partial [Nitrosopumilus sp.]
MNKKFLLSLFAIAFIPLFFDDSFAQITSGGFGNSPFERDFGDVKFLDAYFGTINEKLEVNPGDKNVPFTVVMANVGTQDITGIRGQLSLPLGFSASDGPDTIIYADADSNSLAGDNFHLTFFVDLSSNVQLQQHPGTVKIDYSRLRESGVRTSFEDFKFKVTGESVINVRALNPFLMSLQQNHVTIEISNDGTAPVSSVDVGLKNTQSERASTTQSVTNVENVVILNTDWEIGEIEPGTSKLIELDVYVPESLKGDTLRAPIEITYFDAYGEQHTISRIADFFIQGLIDLSIYNVDVIDLSGKPMIIGEIINEGNEDALFGFVTVEPRDNSNIKKTTQFIDEIETDSPVPFNVPIEFDGTPRYGEHDIKITARYKDDVRAEHFFIYNATVSVEEPPSDNQSNPDSIMIIIPIVLAIGIGIYIIRRR